jgi:hypothetical protein
MTLHSNHNRNINSLSALKNFDTTSSNDGGGGHKRSVLVRNASQSSNGDGVFSFYHKKRSAAYTT